MLLVVAAMASCIAVLHIGKTRTKMIDVLRHQHAARSPQLQHRFRWDDNDGEIDRLADHCNRRIAGQAINIRIVRIDRIDRAGKLVLAQKGQQQPEGNLGPVARGADNGDAGGGEKTVKRMGARSTVGHAARSSYSLKTLDGASGREAAQFRRLYREAEAHAAEQKCIARNGVAL